ncbi:DUF5082 family protein [Streptococcus equinus]|uniref:YwqH-like family protein n=1 Tax=Streptococcus equinus TaxID=1335 RepID=UPI0008D5DAC7|nr:DUF5082 family protein [Streptococcus equinus]UOC11123.1 DUF5082 family protein [Streptococcus equinus]SEI70221.1 protein of unknown function [Streptococcus equinus]
MGSKEVKHYQSCARTCRSHSSSLRSNRKAAMDKKEKLEKAKFKITSELSQVSSQKSTLLTLNNVDTGNFVGDRQAKYQGKMSAALQKLSTYKTSEDDNLTSINNKIAELETTISSLTSQISSWDQQAVMYDRMAASSM